MVTWSVLVSPPIDIGSGILSGVAAELLSVKTGIGGLWQTSGRSRLPYAVRSEHLVAPALPD